MSLRRFPAHSSEAPDMDPSDSNTRLNQIATLWSVVRLAHNDPGEAGRAARAALLERYSGAIHRYLLGALRNSDAADELAQEFAYRFLHGDLAGPTASAADSATSSRACSFTWWPTTTRRRSRPRRCCPHDVPEPGEECSAGRRARRGLSHELAR